MIDRPFDPLQPAGFIVSEPERIAQKLRAFAAAGPEKLHYLFDFDRTLTTSEHTGQDITTWQILHGLLPEEGQRISRATRNKYLALETAGLLSKKDTRQWSATELTLHSTHGTSIAQVEQAARQIRLRDGTYELFTACARYRIPTVILSAGIRDVITMIAQEHRISPSVILSIKLLLSDDGRVIGWERGSMVHTLNKREKGNRELARLRAERPLTLLIGDTVEDARMVDGDTSVLRIRVRDTPGGNGNDTAAYLQQSSRAGYDMVIEGSLRPMVALTNWLNRGGRSHPA